MSLGLTFNGTNHVDAPITSGPFALPLIVSFWLYMPTTPTDNQTIFSYGVSTQVNPRNSCRGTVAFVGTPISTPRVAIHLGDLTAYSQTVLGGIDLPMATWTWNYIEMVVDGTVFYDADYIFTSNTKIGLKTVSGLTFNRFSLGRAGTAEDAVHQFPLVGSIEQYTQYKRALTIEERAMLKLGVNPEELVPGEITMMLHDSGARLPNPPVDRYGLFKFNPITTTGITTSVAGVRDYGHLQLMNL
jgi:hypothetical protein